jgi:RNA-directed DNA polymerase
MRLLEIPSTRMRTAQRTLLHDVFALLPLNDAAHGFVPGRSAVTAARLHTGAAVVITLDLTTFFARVTAGRIYGAFRQAGAGERVALALTGVATNRVPPRVIAAMPPGGDPDERAALRRALAAAHLPQGAPSSPALANLALRRLDSRLAGYAERVDARYTRYADDLTFSGGSTLRRRADAFVTAVRRLVEEENHTVNLQKTRVRPAATSQRVTGIVVNEHTALPRVEFDRLKAILHNAARNGPAAENRGGHADFRAHLLGRISWAASLNPAKGARLRREFDRISW